MDINARLEKLERENRRMKKIGIVAAVVVSMFIVGGQAKTNKVVEANEFRLVDGSGKVRADLTMMPRRAANFSMTIRSTNCSNNSPTRSHSQHLLDQGACIWVRPKLAPSCNIWPFLLDKLTKEESF